MIGTLLGRDHSVAFKNGSTVSRLTMKSARGWRSLHVKVSDMRCIMIEFV
jgi:hypothetical protein